MTTCPIHIDANISMHDDIRFDTLFPSKGFALLTPTSEADVPQVLSLTTSGNLVLITCTAKGFSSQIVPLPTGATALTGVAGCRDGSSVVVSAGSKFWYSLVKAAKGTPSAAKPPKSSLTWTSLPDLPEQASSFELIIDLNNAYAVKAKTVSGYFYQLPVPSGSWGLSKPMEYFQSVNDYVQATTTSYLVAGKAGSKDGLYYLSNLDQKVSSVKLLKAGAFTQVEAVRDTGVPPGLLAIGDGVLYDATNLAAAPVQLLFPGEGKQCTSIVISMVQGGHCHVFVTDSSGALHQSEAVKGGSAFTFRLPLPMALPAGTVISVVQVLTDKHVHLIASDRSSSSALVHFAHADLAWQYEKVEVASPTSGNSETVSTCHVVATFTVGGDRNEAATVATATVKVSSDTLWQCNNEIVAGSVWQGKTDYAGKISVILDQNSLDVSTISIWVKGMPAQSYFEINPWQQYTANTFNKVDKASLLSAKLHDGSDLLKGDARNDRVVTKLASTVKDCCNYAKVTPSAPGAVISPRSVAYTYYRTGTTVKNAPVAPKPYCAPGTDALVIRFSEDQKSVSSHHISAADGENYIAGLKDRHKPLGVVCPRAQRKQVNGIFDWSWSDVWDAVESAAATVVEVVIQPVVDTFKSVITLIVDGLTYVWDCLVDFAGQIMDVFETIWKTVKVFFIDLYNWLAFFFDWGDIKTSASVISSVIREGTTTLYKYAVDKIQGQVLDCLATINTDVSSKIPAAETKVAGRTFNADSVTLDSLIPSENAPSYRSSFLDDLPSAAQWLLEKIIGSLFGISVSGDQSKWTPIVECLKQVQQKAATVFSRISDALEGVVLSTTVSSVIDALKVVLGSFLDLITSAIKAFAQATGKVLDPLLSKLFDLELDIPIVGPLLKLLFPSFGIKLLDVVSVIIAVPFTIGWKLAHGSAPFSSSSLKATPLSNSIKYSILATCCGVRAPIEAAADLCDGGAAKAFGAVSLLIQLGCWVMDLYNAITNPEGCTPLGGAVLALSALPPLISSAQMVFGDQNSAPEVRVVNAFLNVIIMEFRIIQIADESKDNIAGLICATVFSRLPGILKPLRDGDPVYGRAAVVAIDFICFAAAAATYAILAGSSLQLADPWNDLYFRHSMSDTGSDPLTWVAFSPDIIVNANNNVPLLSDPRDLVDTTKYYGTEYQSKNVVTNLPNYLYVRVRSNSIEDEPPKIHLYYVNAQAEMINMPTSLSTKEITQNSLQQAVDKKGWVATYPWYDPPLSLQTHYCLVALCDTTKNHVTLPANWDSGQTFIEWAGAHRNVAWHNLGVENVSAITDYTTPLNIPVLPTSRLQIVINTKNGANGAQVSFTAPIPKQAVYFTDTRDITGPPIVPLVNLYSCPEIPVDMSSPISTDYHVLYNTRGTAISHDLQFVCNIAQYSDSVTSGTPALKFGSAKGFGQFKTVNGAATFKSLQESSLWRNGNLVVIGTDDGRALAHLSQFDNKLSMLGCQQAPKTGVWEIMKQNRFAGQVKNPGSVHVTLRNVVTGQYLCDDMSLSGVPHTLHLRRTIAESSSLYSLMDPDDSVKCKMTFTLVDFRGLASWKTTGCLIEMIDEATGKPLKCGKSDKVSWVHKEVAAGFNPKTTWVVIQSPENPGLLKFAACDTSTIVSNRFLTVMPSGTLQCSINASGGDFKGDTFKVVKVGTHKFVMQSVLNASWVHEGKQGSLATGGRQPGIRFGVRRVPLSLVFP